MSVSQAASDLLRNLNVERRVGDVFLLLYQFIDETQGAAFGWKPFGTSAVSGVDFGLQVSTWRSELRSAINLGEDFGPACRVSNLQATLELIIQNDTISAENSKWLIIALRLLDDSFRGVHPGEVFDGNDAPGFRALRSGLRSGSALIESAKFKVFPRPRRAVAEERGQGRANDLLAILAVMRIDPQLTVKYLLRFSSESADEIKSIGIVPVISKATELAWKVDEYGRYSVSHHADHSAIVTARTVRAVDAMLDDGANLILLPELVSDVSLRRAISARLISRLHEGRHRPLFVFAGSEVAFDDSGFARNRAHVLDEYGKQSWYQDKIHAYTFSSADQIKALNPIGLPEVVGREEAISIEPRCLVLTDISATQRVAILICEDFIQDEPHRKSIVDLCATLIIVPIMAGSRNPAQGWIIDGGMNYVRHPAATSLIANSGALLPAQDDEPSSYCEARFSPMMGRPEWRAIRDDVDATVIGWIANLAKSL